MSVLWFNHGQSPKPGQCTSSWALQLSLLFLVMFRIRIGSSGFFTLNSIGSKSIFAKICSMDPKSK